MFRDRTNLYILYRRTLPHDSTAADRALSYDRLGDDEAGLMLGGGVDGEGVDAMLELPPNFLELTQEIEEILSFISGKVSELNYLYKKNLLPGFNDNSIDMKKIDDLTFTITKNFQKSYNMIKKIDDMKRFEDLKHDEMVMCENIKKKLALQTQQESSKFRKLQNNYIKFLKDDEDYELSFNKQNQQQQQAQKNDFLLDEELEPEADIESYSREALRQSQTVLMEEEQQQQQYHEDPQAKQREEEIGKIAMGVIEISTIFKELENMIIDQGTILDRIDYNLENVAVDLKQADKSFVSSSRTQKRTQKCKLILLLSLCVFALFLIVMMRPSKKVVIEKQQTQQNTNTNTNIGTGTGAMDAEAKAEAEAADDELAALESVSNPLF